VGLVANVIEAAGVPTACLSMIPPLTRATGAPRVIGIAYPIGLPIGRPGDADGQRAVLSAALQAAAVTCVTPRSYVELPFEWPEPRSKAIREPDPPPPITQLLTRKPWLVPKLASGNIPSTAHRG
jgi:hypothetical protein